MESEYNIPINTDFRKDVNVMCNLGQGIEDRAIAETTAKVTKKVILNMYHSGYSLAQIADAVEMTETEVLDIIILCLCLNNRFRCPIGTLSPFHAHLPYVHPQFQNPFLYSSTLRGRYDTYQTPR